MNFRETIFNPLPLLSMKSRGHNMGTLTVLSYPLTKALDFSHGLHYRLPPRLRFSFVISRFKDFESMVVNEKKGKENQMAGTRKTLKIFHLESLCK